MTEPTAEERPVGTNMTAMLRDLEAVRQREELRQKLTEAQIKLAIEFKPPQVLNAGEEHTLYCQWCYHPFSAIVKNSGRFRNSVEYEPLRFILMIRDPNYEPCICDNCFKAVIGSVRAHNNLADRPDIVTNFPLRMAEQENEQK